MPYYRFFGDVRTFAIQIFGKDHPELESLHFYLASIIEQKHIKEEEIAKTRFNFDDSLVFYYCLYRYSHTRLVNLFKFSPIGIIYEYFYENAREEVLEWEPACLKNKPLYEKVLREFLMIFRGEIDIHNIID